MSKEEARLKENEVKEEIEDNASILTLIQTELHCPKSDYNKFGKYSYRKAETILEGVKPLLKKHDCQMVISDTLEVVGEVKTITRKYDGEQGFERLISEEITSAPQVYIRAEVTLITPKGETYTSIAHAREDVRKKGMDGSQISGSTSSYANKYALQNLLLIDDGKDSDSEKEGEVKFTEKHSRPAQNRQKTSPKNRPTQSVKDPVKAAQLLFKEGFEWSSDEVEIYHKFAEFRNEWQRLKGIKADNNSQESEAQIQF